MELIKINVEEECRKRIKEVEKEIFLPYIFRRRIFPRMLYFPPGSFATDKRLITLFADVCALHTVPEKTGPWLKRIAELSLAGDLEIKNQDEILEEKGELIITEGANPSLLAEDEAFSRLYPERKPYYMFSVRVRIGRRPCYILIQAGFIKNNQLKIADNLPNLGNLVLRDEKPVIYPVFDDLLKRLSLVVQYFCLN